MNNIFKYITIAALLYFGINWVADNPKIMKVLRTKMNTAVSAAGKEIKEAVSDIEQSG
mgnify:CR=1 FL=1